jgi:hypothetical protein
MCSYKPGKHWRVCSFMLCGIPWQAVRPELPVPSVIVPPEGQYVVLPIGHSLMRVVESEASPPLAYSPTPARLHGIGDPVLGP